jgi:hypothetical protein
MIVSLPFYDPKFHDGDKQQKEESPATWGEKNEGTEIVSNETLHILPLNPISDDR